MRSKRVSVKALRQAVKHLHRIRVHSDLTYEELAADMGLSLRSVYRIMTEREAGVHERTLYRIQNYIAAKQSKQAEA